MNWIISANSKLYDHAAAFQKWGFIDWVQRVHFNVGDTVYIYHGKPLQRVMFKTQVIIESMTSKDIVDDSMFWKNRSDYEKSLSGKFARLKLIQQANSDLLSLNMLKHYGLKTPPQSQQRLSDRLAHYIDNNMNDYAGEGIFPESSIPADYYEGAVYQVTVNKYERSSIARQRCIEYNGTRCFVCGFDFENVYGELGKDFIHVHHIIPLNEIGKEYVVDYKKDLIPVCPNCHAMLHRTNSGKTIGWVELRDIVQRKK